MLMTEIYINGASAISPCSSGSKALNRENRPPDNPWLKAIEPDYKSFIDARSARRLSRVIKMGVTAALLALKEAEVDTPDAVISGTGYGCMSDTEKFLKSMVETDERFLNPASFIYSTHNTISSQVALQLKCTGYNQTFSHNATSFESALLDSQMLLAEEGFQSVLAGGIDEMTENLYNITRRFGLWKRDGLHRGKTADTRCHPGPDPGSSHDGRRFRDQARNDKPLKQQDPVFKLPGKGSIPGEGAVFLLMESKRSPSSRARLLESSSVQGLREISEIENWIERLLNRHHLVRDDIDLFFPGKNGDRRFDWIYNRLEEGFLKGSDGIAYKQFCGDYPTASAFGCWLAATILKDQAIPETIRDQQTDHSPIRNILLYNQNHNQEHGLILLQAIGD